MSTPAYEDAKESYINLRDKVFADLVENYPEYRVDKDKIEKAYFATNDFLVSMDNAHKNKNILELQVKHGEKDIATVALEAAGREVQEIANIIKELRTSDVIYDKGEMIKSLLEEHAKNITEGSNVIFESWRERYANITTSETYSQKILRNKNDSNSQYLC